MHSDYARAIFTRLCISGALLFIGLLMLIDPASFVASMRSLAGELRIFEQRLKGFLPHERVGETGTGYISWTVRFAIRSFGVVLAVAAVLAFADAVG